MHKLYRNAVVRELFVGSLVALAVTQSFACKTRRDRRPAAAGTACEASLALSLNSATQRWTLRGTVQTAPSTSVFLLGVPRGNNAQSTSDGAGLAQFSVELAPSDPRPSQVSVQCGAIGLPGSRTTVARPSVPLFFVDDHAVGTATCESRRCEFALSASAVTFTAPATAQVTIDSQTVAATGARQSVAMDAQAFIDGVPLAPRESSLSGSDGWNGYIRLRPSRQITLRLTDGTTLSRALHLSARALVDAYSTHFQDARTRAVLPASAAQGQGALYFSNTALMQVFGPVQRFSDVRYVAVDHLGAERRASCGRYRRGTQVISVDRVMRDGVLEVFDPRTGQRVYSEAIRAPERRCQSSMQSITAVMSDYSGLDAERAFSQWFAQRSGGAAPAPLGFETVSEASLQAAASADAGASADAAAGADPSGASTAPPVAPDSTLRATLSAALSSLRYSVRTATTTVDIISGGTEQQASLSHPDHLPTDIAIYSYGEADRRPNQHARSTVRGTFATIVDPTAGTTLTDSEFRGLLAITGNAASVAAGLRRNRFVADAAPETADDMDGITSTSATAAIGADGDRGIAITVRNYTAVPHGGDEPRALRIVGQRVWVATGNDSRAELDRILRLVAR